jgi:hypothetical protein
VDFISPFHPTPRTAVLAVGFREAKRVRVFPDGWGESVRRFKPEVLAGPWEDLLRLAEQWDEGWTTPARGIVIFSFEGQPAPEAGLRDLLWERFGLPLFEQYLDTNLELLASECDAHEGLHLASRALQRPGFALCTNVCPCGGTTPRLCRIEEREHSRTHAVAMASGT